MDETFLAVKGADAILPVVVEEAVRPGAVHIDVGGIYNSQAPCVVPCVCLAILELGVARECGTCGDVERLGSDRVGLVIWCLRLDVGQVNLERHGVLGKCIEQGVRPTVELWCGLITYIFGLVQLILVQSAVLGSSANEPRWALGFNEHSSAGVNADLVCCLVKLEVHIHVVVAVKLLARRILLAKDHISGTQHEQH